MDLTQCLTLWCLPFFILLVNDSDAPALSTQESKAPAGAAAEANAPASATHVGGQQQASSSSSSPDWDDAAHHHNSNKSAAPKIAMEQTTLEMKTTIAGGASDNIAQRMRIEETKAQLAAARQGMEREAQKLAQEKARQQALAAEKAVAVAASGRWVAPHMRASSSSSALRLQQPSRLPGANKLDTASEELFPDLAAAGKILQEKEKSQTTVRVPKKTPVGGGATWASKPKITKTTTATAPTPEPAASTPKKEKEQEQETPPPPLSSAPAAVVETPAPPVPVTPLPTVPPKITRKTGTKKKKRDLSTFKPGGAS